MRDRQRRLERLEQSVRPTVHPLEHTRGLAPLLDWQQPPASAHALARDDGEESDVCGLTSLLVSYKKACTQISYRFYR